MDSVKPAAIAADMVRSGITKALLGPFELALRGGLFGALLGFATSLAIGAPVPISWPIVGALIFPVGFVTTVSLDLEPLTSSCAPLPLVLLRGRASPGAVLANWSGVFAGNLAGSMQYAPLLAIALTIAGQVEAAGGADWCAWNEIPVALGNLVGVLFAGLTFYVAVGRSAAPLSSALPSDAE
jgi:formate/nitrite transporter FocA (FNT family)